MVACGLKVTVLWGRAGGLAIVGVGGGSNGDVSVFEEAIGLESDEDG